MPMLLADSNALRNPGLKAYLAASRDHHIALSDLTLVEMRKRNALSTSRESLLIASKFPAQVFVLKRTHEILELNIAGAGGVDALFDYPAGIELARLMRDLTTLPPPAGLSAEMAMLEREAAAVTAELGRQMADLEAALVSAAAEFKPDELRQLRIARDVSEGTRRTLFRLLKETTGRFFVDNQQRLGRRGIKFSEARGMFALRYSLCMTIYYILWVQTGRQTGRAEHLRLNDVVDMQLAALSTYFNGVLSTDALVLNTSRGARAILRGYGGYVGEDWIVPR